MGLIIIFYVMTIMVMIVRGGGVRVGFIKREIEFNSKRDKRTGKR